MKELKNEIIIEIIDSLSNLTDELHDISSVNEFKMTEAEKVRFESYLRKVEEGVAFFEIDKIVTEEEVMQEKINNLEKEVSRLKSILKEKS
jgi:hypothetical protein